MPIFSPSHEPVRRAFLANHKPAFFFSRQFKKGGQLIGKSHHGQVECLVKPVLGRQSDDDPDQSFDLKSQSMPPSFRIGSNERCAPIIRNNRGNRAGWAADNSEIQL
jgi:hypothetical protein